MAYSVRVYDSKDTYYAKEPANTESEARSLATKWTSAHGQTSWRAVVLNEKVEIVDTYTNGAPITEAE